MHRPTYNADNNKTDSESSSNPRRHEQEAFHMSSFLSSSVLRDLSTSLLRHPHSNSGASSMPLSLVENDEAAMFQNTISHTLSDQTQMRRNFLATSLPVAAFFSEIFDSTPELPTSSERLDQSRCAATADDRMPQNDLTNAFYSSSRFEHSSLNPPLHPLLSQPGYHSLSEAPISLSNQSQSIPTSDPFNIKGTANALPRSSPMDMSDRHPSSQRLHNMTETSRGVSILDLFSTLPQLQTTETPLSDHQISAGVNPSASETLDVPESFPMTLHRLLIDVEKDDQTKDIIMWIDPFGKSFIVHDIGRFEKQIMHKYFPRMKRFASFQRQLNLYNFSRIGGTGPSRIAYCHPMFLRHRGDLAREMKRTKIKGLFKVPLEKRRNRKPNKDESRGV